MNVYCKSCRKVVGRVADEKIPPNVKRHIACRVCGKDIVLFRKPEDTPSAPAAQKRIVKGPDDVKWPSPEPALNDGPTAKAPPQSPSSPPRHGRTLSPQFTGKTGEYFRIWIVNIFLTIVTLGIYAAWAKVRTRRYFYANTTLEGHAFDYLANPVAILRGNIIVGTGLLLYSLSGLWHFYAKITIGVIMWLVFPFLIYKSLRFFTHNSAFRNIRFRFLGSLKGSYVTFLLIPILIPLTAGLILPYWIYRRKKYFFDNVAFGNTESEFAGRVFPFYRIHAVTLAFSVLTLISIVALVVMLGKLEGGFLSGILVKGADGPAGQQLPNIPGAFIVIVGAIYLTWIFFVTFIQQYLFARITNYCWHHSRLGEIIFKSTIQVRRLVWIRITNILAIIFSFGLLAPWAKIRRARYILENISVVAHCDLDDFTAAMAGKEGALGDVATDFLDFEIAL